jgi:predicted aldo/keto reductase-like oxidoreductase
MYLCVTIICGCFMIMNKDTNEISRREALRRLMVGGACLMGAAMGWSACRRLGEETTNEKMSDRPKTGAGSASTGQKIACVGCGLCMPCPYGVDIPGNFQVYNDAVSLDELPDPRQSSHPDFRRNRKRFLRAYHRRMNHLERADHCVGCGRCLPTCPQQLDIPILLSQMASLVDGLRGR